MAVRATRGNVELEHRAKPWAREWRRWKGAPAWPRHRLAATPTLTHTQHSHVPREPPPRASSDSKGMTPAAPTCCAHLLRPPAAPTCCMWSSMFCIARERVNAAARLRVAISAVAARVLAARVLAARVLAARVLAARVLAARVLAARVLAARVLAARVLTSRGMAFRAQIRNQPALFASVGSAALPALCLPLGRPLACDGRGRRAV
ncbi:unnamed protein product [Closterium sp. Naga37s-1]|nr:unnamed protein product [Closterium sp. Naga37s-1]